MRTVLSIGVVPILGAGCQKNVQEDKVQRQEDTNHGSFPVSPMTSSAASSSNMTGTTASRSGTTDGVVAGSTADNDSGEQRVGAFAVAGTGVTATAAGPMDAPAEGAAGATDSQGETYVAQAVTTDDLAANIREELRSEFRREIQNLSGGAPIASAEVVVPARHGDEATGMSQITGDKPSAAGNKPWWKSKWSWVVTLLLVAVCWWSSGCHCWYAE